MKNKIEIQNRYEIIAKLSNELLNDRELMLLASEKGVNVLDNIKSSELTNDREIVLNCVKIKGYALRYTSVELKTDREIVLEAIKNNGCAFNYACIELQQDLESILSAIRTSAFVLRCISNELQNDREFILKCVKINGECLGYVPQQLLNDIEIINEACKQNPFSIKYIINNDIMINNCKNTILNSIEKLNVKYSYDTTSQYTNIIKNINDTDVIIKLIETIPFAIHFVDEKFKSSDNKELIYRSTLLHSGYWMNHSENAFQERINHAYYSAKIDSTSEINYYRNLNKEHLLWEGYMEWKKWERRLI